MRWSRSFIPTLRENPAKAETPSHRLLLRAGYIRQLTAGVFSLLPLGQKVRLKMIKIIREEMGRIGAQEFLLPALQPAELWKESGRWSTIDIMFRLTDRRGTEMALGLTHEEVFTSIVRHHIKSYKQLPQIWYQIQTKFRDEVRPKAGLLRVREFTMKDSYSFDQSDAGLDESFRLHYNAYQRIFERFGLACIPVEASSGDMGGNQSTEFMVLTDSGEDQIAICPNCSYAANLEKAISKAKPANGDCLKDNLVEFPTPGVRTIEDLEAFPGGASAKDQIKTLAYWLDDRFVLVILRGDHELNQTKLLSCGWGATLRKAEAQEIVDRLGAMPGSLGAVGVRQATHPAVTEIIADQCLKDRSNMVTGANRNGYHLRGVCIDRDIEVSHWADVRSVHAGELCSYCDGSLEIKKALEVGHIFKLGTRYSEIMRALILDSAGQEIPIAMGSYGIGVERAMAAAVELHNDVSGVVWPLSIAPFQLIIVPTSMHESGIVTSAEQLYDQATEAGIDTLLDDRDERAGVKFNDADLIGIPFRITVGKKQSEGAIELQERKTGQSEITSSLAVINKIRCQMDALK
jgi:prolyl-tRNA synthetase